jgi:hypothetical protein
MAALKPDHVVLGLFGDEPGYARAFRRYVLRLRLSDEDRRLLAQRTDEYGGIALPSEIDPTHPINGNLVARRRRSVN